MDKIDKNRILEIAFETLKDSTEWGIESENKLYGYYVDGVVAMTDRLLGEFDNKYNDVIS